MMLILRKEVFGEGDAFDGDFDDSDCWYWCWLQDYKRNRGADGDGGDHTASYSYHYNYHDNSLLEYFSGNGVDIIWDEQNSSKREELGIYDLCKTPSLSAAGYC